MSLFCIFLVFADFFFPFSHLLPPFLFPLLHWVVFPFLIDLYDFLRCLHINSSSVIRVDWDLKMPCSKHFKGHQVKKLLSEIISEPFPDALCSCLLVSALSVRIWTSNYTLTSYLFSDGAPPLNSRISSIPECPPPPCLWAQRSWPMSPQEKNDSALSSVCPTQASPPLGK